MSNSLRVVPPPVDTRRGVPPLLSRLWQVVADAAYGIHAGNAIRHGLPAPRRAGVGRPDLRLLRRSNHMPD